MSWSLDCSMMLAVILPDEGSELSDKFFRGLADEDLWVPALFWYELSSVLSRASRQDRLREADVTHAIEIIKQVMVKTDYLLGTEAIQRSRELARKFGISAYDAAYLELALRRGIGLATLDERLARAAKKAGGRVYRN
jgi:predicted nucleic acid-binding protein